MKKKTHYEFVKDIKNIFIMNFKTTHAMNLLYAYLKAICSSKRNINVHFDT